MRSRAWHLLGAIAATIVVTFGMAGGAISANAATTTPGSGSAVTPAADPVQYFTIAGSDVSCQGYTIALQAVPNQPQLNGHPVTGATTDSLTLSYGGTGVNSGTAPSQLGFGNKVTTATPNTYPANETIPWPSTNGSGAVTQVGITGEISSYEDSDPNSPSDFQLSTPVTIQKPTNCPNVTVSNQTNECSSFHVSLGPDTGGSAANTSGTAAVKLTYTGSTATQTVNLAYPAGSTPADVTISWPSGATAVSNSATITPSDSAPYMASSTSAFTKPSCTATAPATVQSDLGAAPKGHSWVTGAEIGGPAGVLILGGVILLARRRTRTTQA